MEGMFLLLHADELKDILNNSIEFVKTSNYFFENHHCCVLNDIVKVQLKYTIAENTSDRILKIGKCEHCNNSYYTENFESNSKL
jgi:hypothetical protein